MAYYNTRHSYGIIAKSFHWIIALLVIGMVFLGFFMGKASPTVQITLYTVHKSTGLTILLLMVLRLCWRIMNSRPQLPTTMSRGSKLIAGFSHFLMYLILICMPLSGWIMSTASGHIPNFWWLIKIPMPWVHQSTQVASIAGNIHEVLAWAIVILVSLHIFAAIWHHFVKKDNVLKSMIPCHKSF